MLNYTLITWSLKMATITCFTLYILARFLPKCTQLSLNYIFGRTISGPSTCFTMIKHKYWQFLRKGSAQFKKRIFEKAFKKFLLFHYTKFNWYISPLCITLVKWTNFTIAVIWQLVIDQRGTKIWWMHGM